MAAVAPGIDHVPVEPRTTDPEAATVADAMSRGIVRCARETRLCDVAHLMAVRKVREVFVYDYGEEADETPELLGLVSDLDLVVAMSAGLAECTAGEAAVVPLVTVRSSDSLEHAADLMAEHGSSDLAVIDADSGRPAGVISTLDVARALSPGLRNAARAS